MLEDAILIVVAMFGLGYIAGRAHAAIIHGARLAEEIQRGVARALRGGR